MQNNDNQTNQKDPQNRGQNGFEYISPGLCSIWLGWRDSNPRMHGPKPCALPLGDTPSLTIIHCTIGDMQNKPSALVLLAQFMRPHTP